MVFLAEGGFSDVYDLGDGTVLKAYKQYNYSSQTVLDWRDHHLVTKDVFTTELEAYQKLKEFDDLQKYVPTCYGVRDPNIILNPKSIYVSGCGLRLEKIPGTDIKITYAGALRSDIEEILGRMHDEVGIEYVWDASVFIPGIRTPFTLIDFALNDRYPILGQMLDEHGKLSKRCRERLEDDVRQRLERGM